MTTDKYQAQLNGPIILCFLKAGPIIMKILTMRCQVRMRNVLMIVVLATTVGLVGLQQANAGVGDHGGERSHRQSHKQNDATNEKLEKFQADNKDLRKQIEMKQAEQIALIQTETPNIEAVKKASEELFDLRTALMEKAKAAGLFMFMNRDDKDGAIAENTKIEKFFNDTKELMKQMFVKQAGIDALMNSRAPDATAIANITGELFDLETIIREKAKGAGLPKYFHEKGWGNHHQGWRISK